MRCISLWNPWAMLLASGAKKCETRGGKHLAIPRAFRGPLLVHAAKKWNADMAYTAASPPFRAALEAAGVVFTADEAWAKAGWNLPFGAVVGRVEVVGCYRVENVRVGVDPGETLPLDALGVSRDEIAFGDFGPGRFAWLCTNAVRFPEPIAVRGRQGLFDIPDDLIPEAYRCRA